MIRGCITCGASFVDKPISLLKDHLNLCSENKPFLNDENADFYEEV